MRYTLGQPAKKILPPELLVPEPYTLPQDIKLPSYTRLTILVWNIYKQQRTDWKSVLEDFGKNSQLILLQEAQTNPDFIRYITENYAAAEQVPALNLPQHPSGVMTLSTSQPVYCCPLQVKEPLLRLAKSTLITVYPMPRGKFLMAVNIHAINFSLGLDIYRKQLKAIEEHIQCHEGPVILAGDFNAWSRMRSYELYAFTRRLSLRAVKFDKDTRSKVFGRPIDFIFYRDMVIFRSDVMETIASDHNPIRAEFNFLT